MLLDAAAAKMVNLDKNALKYNISWTWICPRDFNCESSAHNKDKFAIKNSQLPKVTSDLKYLKSYDFALQIRSGYGAFNGLPYLQRVFGVTWLGPPSNVKLIFAKVNSMSQRLVVALNISNQDWFKSIAIKWSLAGTNSETNDVVKRMNKDSAFLNSDNKIKFIVDKDSFTRQGKYRVKLELLSTDFNGIKIYEKYEEVSIVSGPYGGSLSIDSPQGSALVYEFTIKAENWKSNAKTKELRYQYFY